MEIKSYRDTPKRGETDAKWCAFRSENGHVIESTVGHETEEEARAAVTPPRPSAMTTKHTRGPWAIAAQRFIMADPMRDGRQIAAIDPFEFGAEAREANARLIAAAPDLLAALRSVLDLHIAHHNNPAHAAARAAIRKATEA
jgi:ADP-ribose pyrophosphatase YjhB (NUDIX family)